MSPYLLIKGNNSNQYKIYKFRRPSNVKTLKSKVSHTKKPFLRRLSSNEKKIAISINIRQLYIYRIFSHFRGLSAKKQKECTENIAFDKHLWSVGYNTLLRAIIQCMQYENYTNGNSGQGTR